MTRLLVIDDEDHIRMEIAEALRLEGVEVTEAAQGLEGVQLARDTLPDLIICDITMPGLDGYGTLTALRADSRTSQIPFIFLTAKSDYDDQREGMRRGADDYLIKPFTHDQLFEAIATRLEIHRRAELLRAKTVAQRAIQVLEDERYRLAFDLEQSVRQTLAALRLSLRTRQQLPVATFESVLDSLLDNTQNLIHGLYPTMLDQLGLLPTLLWQLDQFQVESGIPVHFEHNGLGSISDAGPALGLYRVLQRFFEISRPYATNIQIHIWRAEDTLHTTAHAEIAQPIHPTNNVQILIDELEERLLSLSGRLSLLLDEKIALVCDMPLSSVAQPAARVTLPTVQPQMPAPPLKAPAPNAEAPFTVIIADGSAIVREGLQHIMKTEGGYKVIGATEQGATVPEIVREQTPDILILDLMMPGLGGVHIARQVMSLPNPPRILMLSTQIEQAYVLEALRAGVLGYMLKQATREEIVTALAHVAQGEQHLSHVLSKRALQAYLEEHLVENRALDGYQTLTEREREVLQLLAEGYKNSQIAEKLSISPRTSETHRANLMRKLGLQTQVDLVRYAIQRGLIPLQE
ncbi:MAG: response regulator [Anaerolineales bacterium]